MIWLVKFAVLLVQRLKAVKPHSKTVAAQLNITPRRLRDSVVRSQYQFSANFVRLSLPFG